MTRDAGLTVDQIVKALYRMRRRETGEFVYLGDGILECALCNARLTGATAEGWYPDPRRASYSCTGCQQVSALVTVVHREVQSLTRQRLSDSSVIARWRAQRLSTLDARITQARTVLAWGRDEQRCAQLGRKLAPLGRVTPRRAAVDAGLSDLDGVAGKLFTLVTERAALSGAPKSNDARHITELKQARWNFIELNLPLLELQRRMPPRQLIRAFGGRKKYAAYQAELHRLRLPFWDLLDQTNWYNPEPARLPAQDEALMQDWSQSPAYGPSQRRELLLLALGGDRLAVGPATKKGKRVRVIPAQQEPLKGDRPDHG